MDITFDLFKLDLSMLLIQMLVQIKMLVLIKINDTHLKLVYWLNGYIASLT